MEIIPLNSVAFHHAHTGISYNLINKRNFTTYFAISLPCGKKRHELSVAHRHTHIYAYIAIHIQIHIRTHIQAHSYSYTRTRTCTCTRNAILKWAVFPCFQVKCFSDECQHLRHLWSLLNWQRQANSNEISHFLMHI